MQQRRESLDRRMDSLEARERELRGREKAIEQTESQAEQIRIQASAELERVAGLDRQEARVLLLKEVEQDARQDLARVGENGLEPLRRAVAAVAARPDIAVPAEAELSLALSDDATVQGLNRDYRAKDKPTAIPEKIRACLEKLILK